ncbi:undecaprenyl-diphosphate phosphatase [Rhodoluna lacicola]|uniref:Undecaprenyl-diphosphatase n=1 Tax=Rhodoluna lacicola TaxID=529884 RepID=A0A060JM31_9MICO|nr:undecaprenyl-diphosphate phosphatase [Rhodoluna lacicola]AIC47618.1 undecaprenyl-diphosphatase UppP [Rhodoluna lacicola]BDS50515.1 undecaprenyl-diphosphatase 2 [Rhodoluna lacicola]
MTPFDAVILGIVQGLTEFLPISSSAHVQIAQQLLGLSAIPKPQLTAFIATIQLGTEAAVLIYFWRDIVRIVKAFFGTLFAKSKQSTDALRDAKLGWLIIIGSIPVVAIGLIFQDAIENQLRSLWVIAFTLIIFGVILGIADRIGKRQRSIEQLTTKHGILFGLGQALAVIPGVSRSGGTISVGLLLGYSRQAAARYSFLLAIPAVIASGFYEFASTYQDLNSSELVATAVATVVSFVVGFSVIVGLLRYLSRGSFMPFVFWRVSVGVILLVLLSTNQLQA